MPKTITPAARAAPFTGLQKKALTADWVDNKQANIAG